MLNLGGTKAWQSHSLFLAFFGRLSSCLKVGSRGRSLSAGLSHFLARPRFNSASFCCYVRVQSFFLSWHLFSPRFCPSTLPALPRESQGRVWVFCSLRAAFHLSGAPGAVAIAFFSSWPDSRSAVLSATSLPIAHFLAGARYLDSGFAFSRRGHYLGG